MIKFYKVSYEQFKKDVYNCGFTYIKENEIKEIYDNIKLPKRATKTSAGYDFYSPFYIDIEKGNSVRFPTGIRCEMDDDVVLLLVPRSGLGFKYGLALENTIGVIDSDYFNAKNEGHIGAKIHTNNKELTIIQGEAYMQGIFVRYLKTVDDDTKDIRLGGFGSTDKNIDK